MTTKKTQILIIFFPILLYSCTTLKPLAPANTGMEVPKIVQPVSNIEVPVTADLKSYFVQAENAVPNKYADNQQPCEGLRYNYTFTRTPFTITGSSNVVNLKFTGAYGFTASYCAKCATLFGSELKPVTPVISAQCGVGEPLRRMVISYQSTINVLPDYRLSSKTILYPAPNAIDRCNVMFGKLDVTDRLIGLLTKPLNDLGKQVDAKIAAYNIKPMVDQLWKQLSAETKLGDVGFLNINPQSVRLSSFNLNGSLLNFSVGLSAKPVVTTVSAPQPAKPLPNLSTYIPANGFNIYLDLIENYDHLTHTIKEQIAGYTTDIAGKTFIVDDVKVSGIGKKVVLQIDFKGSSVGTIYLVGTPTYDSVSHQLSFPDLSFDLQTSAWILKAAKWMFNSKITDAIRNKATYNFTQFLAENKEKIQSQLTRDMGNHFRSEVIIKSLDIQTIYPTSEKLIIRTMSSGQIKVTMVM